MPLYEFVCPAGHKHDAIRPRSVEVEPCACGQASTRTAVNRIGFSGFAGTPEGQQDFREDYRRFREATETLEHQHGRVEESAQRQVAPPPLFSAARAQATDMAKHGVSADQIRT